MKAFLLSIPKTIANNISIILVLAAAFFVPFFFLPFTSEQLEFNKQALVIVLAFTAFLALILKALFVGQISFRGSVVNSLAVISFLGILVAAIFSQDTQKSLFGFGFGAHEAAFTALGFLFLYLVIISSFTNRSSLLLIRILLLAGLAAAIMFFVFVSGVFGSFVSPDFSTIGSTSSQGLFLSAAMALALGGAMLWRGFWKKISVAAAVFIFITAAFVFQHWVWIVFSAAALFMLVVYLVMFKKLAADFYSTLILASATGLAIGLIFFPPPISLLYSSGEISPSYSASADIAVSSLVNKPLFGFGPGNWDMTYNLYFPSDVNNGNFWNVSFAQSGSKMLTIPAIGGLTGLVSWIIFVGATVLLGLQKLAILPSAVRFSGLKNMMVALRQKFFEEKSDASAYDYDISHVIFPAFFAWLVLALGQLFLGSNMTLETFFWLLSGLLVAASKKQARHTQIDPSDDNGELSFIKFPRKSLAFQFLTVSAIILLIGILASGIFFGRRYKASLDFYRGNIEFNQGKYAQAAKFFQSAAALEPVGSLYLRAISDAAVNFITAEISSVSVSETKLSQLFDYASVASDAVDKAVLLEPNQVDNWAQSGRVYKSLASLLNVGGAREKSKASWDKAITLAPKNPQLVTELGKLQYDLWVASTGNNLSPDSENYFAQAQGSFLKAIDLKKNYVPAHFNLGFLYYQSGKIQEAQNEFSIVIYLDPANVQALTLAALILDDRGDKAGAIAHFQRIHRLRPNDTAINQVLENLRAGKSAREGLSDFGLVIPLYP
ncbi:MAG: hypothetical protein A3A80_04055 [Candidatus Terrybacteria bacterium RIFCSPLOWO2_01_FULL_44_24]|uniref:Tetratricopeptide repeat protein n=1 Tax=Candidatus Terrybacteria bacterium RIFCSPHIGHO2_01_FULL_43_35 TaxID=1802361 RepID=A0A1G2PGC6_9BACT|nr:MAG: hypothetical protein A2828_02980 [Candidatus Terrybacteria bacterium RIFCSPHIGHO2_01_FULL_43_35]OHA50183.1 MAG: hypothetical protein A3B75_01640 [Candidatus Terrybacteria bacterium RIFCSPHIGHO2_02_FULL_43_14]OHA51242.1 MAG: hypothetical protein A3A80_04055 [Candidatus Terrybacteria bacterium RIFCSPLOWO2_01_FULL_44_24]